MKIKLMEDVIVDVAVLDGQVGCHLIACEQCPREICEVGQCEIETRGLGGEYYPIELIKDLIVEGDA